MTLVRKFNDARIVASGRVSMVSGSIRSSFR
jgi:hypothetical protein